MFDNHKIKLLVVDDELPIREMFRLTVDWAANGVEVTGFAKNGEDAVLSIQENEPGIVLTDVKMLIMDGIMLSKWISENRPRIKVIILSAYCDFEYAQKAMKYGVVDYLSKPVDFGLLFETIHKIRKELNERKAAENEYEKLKKTFASNMPVLREKYIHDVLDGTYKGDLAELIKLYDINLVGELYIVAIISIEQKTTVEAGSTGLQIDTEILRQEFKEWIHFQVNNKYKVFCFNESSTSSGVVFAAEGQTEKALMLRNILNIMEHGRKVFFEKKCILTIGTSNVHSGLDSLTICYREACKAIKAMIYMGTNLVIRYEELNYMDNSTDEDSNETDRLFEYMKNYDWHNAFLYINKYFECCLAKPGIIEKYPQLAIFELLAVLKKLHAYDEYFPKLDMSSEAIDKLLQLKTLKNMRNGITQLFKSYFDLMVKQRENKPNKLVMQIKEYINNNYMDDASLTDVSEKFYLSPSYLSRLLLNETGMTFLEYLTHCRMEKAKELLLKENLKVYEVSHLVGYGSEKHFIRLFKKVTGFSPMKFKERKLNPEPQH